MGSHTRVGHTVAAGAIGALALGVCGFGVAAASNGGTLTLGHHNKATATTSLIDKKGTPLALVAKSSRPPLSVNSSKLVKHLNAAEVGGLTPAQLSTGSAAQHGLDIEDLAGIGNGTLKVVDLPLAVSSASSTTYFPILAVRTAPLAAGTYYVTATAFGEGPQGVLCFIGTTDTFPNGNYQYGVINTDGSLSEAVEDQAFSVTAGQRVSEWCVDPDSSATDDPAALTSYAISAIRVAASRPGQATVPSSSVNDRAIRRPTSR